MFCALLGQDTKMSVYRTIGSLVNRYGHGGHLGHVISIISLNSNFLVPKSLHTKFCSKWPTGF